MRSIFLMALLACTLLSISCKDKPSDAAAAKKDNDTAMAALPVEFIPPADSVITKNQLLSWSACNALLDSLTFRYADSFKVHDPVAIIRYQEDYIRAQDIICARAGLRGGYREYSWVLENMGISKNKVLLESVNAKSF